MQTVLKWIRQLPLSLLVIMTLFLGLAPFQPEPHLWEKLKMLVAGDLVKLIDIFDLMMHSAPALLLAIRLFLNGRHGSKDV